MRDRYSVVGLTEELLLTVKLLEATLPTWFRGASLLFAGDHKLLHVRKTAAENALTHTRQTGCVSDTAKAILSGAENFMDEMTFYRRVKERFWYQVVSAGLTSERRLRP